MKFYYNGKLIRTSKNHEYTHAVIDITTGKCKGCRANEYTASTIISTECAWYERQIDNYRNAIKALESGKKGYYAKDGRRTYFSRFDADASVENYTRWIEWNMEHIKEIKANWKVVELEAR